MAETIPSPEPQNPPSPQPPLPATQRSPAPETASTGPLGTAPAPATDAPPIFKGPVSHWLAFKSYLAAAFVILLGLAALIYGSFTFGTGMGYTAIIGGLVLMAASALMVLYLFLRIRSTRYTITYRLIERETGILVKNVDALDLGRVKNVEMTQSIIERMINVGTIEVYSSDAEHPELFIEGIPNSRAVYERLRDAVIDLARRRGVILE